VASRIDTGMMFVNHPTWTTPALPFGGIKNSGYGRELSRLGHTSFFHPQAVQPASAETTDCVSNT
jgi:succinate-semialdehyde dehydrogenase / glutarate-semialdehyde dehydrogenase